MNDLPTYIHRVVNNFMVSNGGGWDREIQKAPEGYRLDRIIPLDVYTSCIIFIRPAQPESGGDDE